MSPRRRSPPPTSRAPAASTGERLQKLLAAAGLGSRREIERWIEAGRIRIGERVATLGDRARPGESLFLDEKPIRLSAKPGALRIIAYHKPVGEMVTRSDPGGRPTVFERLPPGRWVSVGRLDVNSSGLLLFTDSGELANRLMHPRYGVEREYEVRVQGGLSAEAVRRLRSGVALEDGPARVKRLEAMPSRAQVGTNRWYRMVLTEGRNREVRRMVEAVGARVSRLVRVRFGPISLPIDLPPGQWVGIDAPLRLSRRRNSVKLQKL